MDDDISFVSFGYDLNHRANFLNGSLADSLKSFQTKLETKIGTGKTLIDYLKVDDWCYHYNVALTDSDGKEYYGAYERIYINKNPFLKCTGTKLNKYKDNTDMYVGILTADKMSFAGAANSNNYTCYLMSRYAKDYYLFWRLTPYYYNAENGNDYEFLLDQNGSLNNDYDVYNYGVSSRPTVTIKSNIQILSGDGTQNNPYVIE